MVRDPSYHVAIRRGISAFGLPAMIVLPIAPVLLAFGQLIALPIGALLLAFGQLIALPIAAVVAWRASHVAFVRVGILGIALAIAVTTWNLPQIDLVGRHSFSASRPFIVGLAPAAVAAVLALLWRSFRR
jgi:hypothetical protein